MRFTIDLHNHSCLSPCGHDEFIPSLLALEAKDKGIDIVALTDHNATANLPAFRDACELVGITGVYGMEITTVEEVHLLSLFETVEEALDFSAVIEESLVKHPHSPRLFGHQRIVDVGGEETGQIEYLLFGPSSYSFEELITMILSYGGLAVPAHIDRPSNSAIANLGFLPDAPYSAIEMMRLDETYLNGPYTVIQGSDAHALSQVGRRTSFIEGEKPDFTTLKQCFKENRIIHRI